MTRVSGHLLALPLSAHAASGDIPCRWCSLSALIRQSGQMPCSPTSGRFRAFGRFRFVKLGMVHLGVHFMWKRADLSARSRSIPAWWVIDCPTGQLDREKVAKTGIESTGQICKQLRPPEDIMGQWNLLDKACHSASLANMVLSEQTHKKRPQWPTDLLSPKCSWFLPLLCLNCQQQRPVLRPYMATRFLPLQGSRDLSPQA